MRSGPETEDVRSSIGGELTKACLGILRDTWPARLAFNELEKIAREKVGKPGGSGNELCESLFACLEANLIEADLQDAAYTAYVPERPHTTALARLQALRHDSPTSLRHQAVRLESISRQVLALCNGERDREAILAELLVMAQRGELRIEERHGTVMNAAVIRSTLEPVLDRVLRQLSQHAFFKR